MPENKHQIESEEKCVQLYCWHHSHTRQHSSFGRYTKAYLSLLIVEDLRHKKKIKCLKNKHPNWKRREMCAALLLTPQPYQTELFIWSIYQSVFEPADSKRSQTQEKITKEYLKNKRPNWKRREMVIEMGDLFKGLEMVCIKKPRLSYLNQNISDHDKQDKKKKI